jgi:hypothetical protein
LRRKPNDGPLLAGLAGAYIYGNGSVYEHITVTENGRYRYQWQSHVILSEPHAEDRFESQGRCAIVDGVLRLVPEGPFSSELRRMMGNDFVAVRWGGRRYLIPEKERLVFCSSVSRGAVPRYMRSGPFSIRNGDDRKVPQGLPEVPPEWAPFLLRKAVEGAIVQVLPNDVAVLSAGAKDGLRAGMEFVRRKGFASRMKVLFCEADRSWVRISEPARPTLPESSPHPFDMMLRPEPFVVGERFLSAALEPGIDE